MSRSFQPHLFIILGASGDLTARKLVPALFRLMERHDDLRCCHILGVARSEMSDKAFRSGIRRVLAEQWPDHAGLPGWCDRHVYYQSLGPSGGGFPGLARRIEHLEEAAGLPGNRVFYLALPPRVFPTTIEAIGEVGLHEARGWTRLVVEKPFGHDLASARDLNALVHQCFRESQVFRIDHYLGKETVQNLLVFRFGNALFESIWNRGQIDRVEISVHETLGVETRAGYYDQSGALRDMVQNHLTQLLALVAMEAPARFDAGSIRREKIKLLESVVPLRLEHVLFGQYVAGAVDGRPVRGYRQERGVSAHSETETFVRLRLEIANWRWRGVPFILETGKRMPRKCTKILIRFQPAPVSLFRPYEDTCNVRPNLLEITLQPNEGFDLHFEVKEPRMPLRLAPQTLRFRYDEAFGDLPEAYETLLGDILQGDQTLFVHADEVIDSWRIYTPILEDRPPVHAYAPGSSGPEWPSPAVPSSAAPFNPG